MSIAPSKFYCLACTNSVPLPRSRGKLRGRGHLKSIYCIKCQEKVNHIEVREFDFEFDIDKFKKEVQKGVYKDRQYYGDGG